MSGGGFWARPAAAGFANAGASRDPRRLPARRFGRKFFELRSFLPWPDAIRNASADTIWAYAAFCPNSFSLTKPKEFFMPEQKPLIPVLIGADMNCYSMARTFHEAYGVTSCAFGRWAMGETM